MRKWEYLMLKLFPCKFVFFSQNGDWIIFLGIIFFVANQSFFIPKRHWYGLDKTAWHPSPNSLIIFDLAGGFQIQFWSASNLTIIMTSAGSIIRCLTINNLTFAYDQKSNQKQSRLVLWSDDSEGFQLGLWL